MGSGFTHAASEEIKLFAFGRGNLESMFYMCPTGFGFTKNIGGDRPKYLRELDRCMKRVPKLLNDFIVNETEYQACKAWLEGVTDVLVRLLPAPWQSARMKYPKRRTGQKSTLFKKQKLTCGSFGR